MKVSSAILTDMSGKLGGAVAAKARGGIQYFRALVRPSNPRSTAQSAARLILASLAAAWAGSLTDGERTGWAAVAASGESGIDAYIKVNAQVLRTGQTRVDVAPDTIALAVNPLTAIAIDVSDSALKFTNSTFNDDLYVNVYMNLVPQASSRLAQRRHTTYFGSVPLDAAAAQTVSLASFPGIDDAVAGDIVYVRFVQVDINGKVATEQLVRVTVTA